MITGQPVRLLTPFRSLAVLLTANLIWAGSYVSSKVALHELAPVTLAFLRFAIASVMLIPLAIYLHRRGRTPVTQDPGYGYPRGMRVHRQDIPMVIFIGMFGVAVSYLIGYWGMQLTTATNSALVISAEPIFTALLSIILLRERVERRQMALLLVGVAGAYLIVGNGLPPQKILGDRFAEGNALVALSLLCEAGYTVLAKRVMQRMSALVITIYATWIGTLVLLPAALLTHTNSGIGAAFLPATPAGWAGVLYISAGCTVAAYLLWNLVVQSVPASVAGAFLFIQPVVGAFLGIILLGDRLTWATLLGALVIFASLILVARSSNLVQAEADVLH